MTERRPPTLAALLEASDEQLADWSDGIELPDIPLDGPTETSELSLALAQMDEGEAQLAELLLAGAVTAPEDEAQASLWTRLVEGWHLMWRQSLPLVPVAMLALILVWSPKAPPVDVLRSKGNAVPGDQGRAALYLLRSKIGQRQAGSFLKDGAKLSARESISVGFRLAAPGGYVHVAWARRGEAPAWLYRSAGRHPAKAIQYLKRKGQILKFPLAQEKPGQVCLLLLQTQGQRAVSKSHISPLLHRQAPPDGLALLASAQFCFVIER